MDPFAWLDHVILAHAGAWWTYAVMGLLCYVDGFFPPVPSESLVIALAALASVHGGPVRLWVLVPVAVVGAYLGDQTAYWLGRLIPLRRLLRGESGERRIARARRLIDERGPEVLLTARFIPVYRVAITMAAGALRFPYRRFLLLDAAATMLWAALAVAIGLASGALFREHPALGIAVGVATGLLIGLGIDAVGRRRRAGRGR